MQFSTKMIATFVALQGADSLGTSAAYTEKEPIKINTLDMMDMIDFFIIKYLHNNLIFQNGAVIRKQAIAHHQNAKPESNFEIFDATCSTYFIACIYKLIKEL
jgi:hypothetical protein